MNTKRNSFILCFSLIIIATMLHPSPSQAKVLYGVSVGGNRDMPGDDYARFGAQSVEDCVKKCADDKRCAAFSFNPVSQVCRLKNRVPEAVRVSGMISGIKLPVPDKTKKSDNVRYKNMEIMKSTNLPGGNYQKMVMSNAQKCSQLCAEDPYCKGFSFNRSKKSCSLKNYLSQPVHARGFKSGRKLYTDDYDNDPPDYVFPGMEIMRNTYVSGVEYEKIRVKKAEKCAQICMDDPRCDAFSFLREDRTCWLKSFEPKLIRKRGTISGIKR